MALKKTHKKIIHNLNYQNHLLKTGSYGFKIMSNFRLTEKQIISLERTLKTKLKKLSIQGQRPKTLENLEPNKTLTKLSLESRMGKGKGSIYTKALFLKKGSIICEFINIGPQQVNEVHRFFKKYISVGLKLVYRK